MATEYNIDENGMYEMIGAKTIKTYKEITDSRTPLAKFDCFVAFTDKQFNEAKMKLGVANDKDLVSLGYGVFGTREGAKRLLQSYADKRKQIAKECDPQEVYAYEFNNHESCINYDGDKEAIQTVMDIFGRDIAKTIKRRCAFYSLEDLTN